MGNQNDNSNNLNDYNRGHVDLLFPSHYLKAGDLRGQDVTIAIADIEPRHELKIPKINGGVTVEHKPCVRFKGTDKLWILNKTNAKTIAKIYGPESMDWIGKRITLFSDEVKAFGELVDAVRVRPKAPTAKATNGASKLNEPAPEDDPPDLCESENDDYGPPLDDNQGDLV